MKNKSIKAYCWCFRIALLVTLFVVSTLSIAFGKDHVDIKGGKISVSIEVITISNEIEIYSPDGSYVSTIDLTEEESNEI